MSSFSRFLAENSLLVAFSVPVLYHIAWRIRAKLQRRKWARVRQEADLSDTNNQLRFVAEADFSKKPIMSKEAYYVFNTVEQFIKERNQGHRILPEVCLGSVLWCNEASEDHRAFKSINSKRLDIGIIDKFGNLRLAIEYQGGGHWQGNARGRDAVKRLALQKAGIPLLEILPQENPVIIRSKLCSMLGWVEK